MMFSTITGAIGAAMSAVQGQYLKDLREYRKGREQADAKRQDLDTLATAAEVRALYLNEDVDGNPIEGESWQDQMDREAGPARGSMARDGVNRFAKWIDLHDGPKRTAVRQFLAADELARESGRGASTSVLPTHEWQVRPLKYLQTEEKPGEIPKVWKAAVKLAKDEGLDAPTAAHVRKALSAWKRENEPKTADTAARRKRQGAKAKVRQTEQDIRALLAREPQLMAPVLRRILSEYEAKVAAAPPMEEW